MKRRRIRRVLRVISLFLLLAALASGIVFHQFTSPKSDDEILQEFKEEGLHPKVRHVRFKGNNVRVLQMKASPDPTLPTIFFIHGSPGSLMDFKRYLKDADLNARANIMAYERVGYGEERRGEVLPSVAAEVELFHHLSGHIPEKDLIPVGYSYGGTIVMASNKAYRKKIALAAAVRGELEPMFWGLNLYKWNWTRPLVPKVFRGAAEEKFRHLYELKEYDQVWARGNAPVVAIHGKKDRIVPYENSVYLEHLFSDTRFRLVSLDESGHALVWTDFDKIKSELIKSLD
jgi:pimeloyl-ACP methyl ester carboxylesterase